jgi:signal transduction histidine kinase/ligand-binding sensor domain-containing protein
LLRFDGVRNVAWQPPSGQSLPSTEIWTLQTSRDGSLWIGTSKGLASWKSGKLTRYPALDGFIVQSLLEDRQGSLWAGGSATPTGKLCEFHNSNVRCFGADGGFGLGVFGLYEDSKGNLWAGVVRGLWRWKPGPPKFFPITDEPDSISNFGESDGTLLICTRNGIQRFVDGKTDPYRLPGTGQVGRPGRLLRDREGGLWIATFDRGLLHAHQGRVDVFSQSDGLSGDEVWALFEDREGNVWAATASGLDRFRDFAVPTLSGNHGLSNTGVLSVLADRDGSVWMGTGDGLKRWNQGHVTAYYEHARSASGALPGIREIVGSGLPDRGVGSLFQDDRGRVWVATVGGVGYLEDDRFVLIRDVPGGILRSIAEDTQANLWINNQEFGLFQVLRGAEVKRVSWAALGRKDFATALVGDRLRGGLWLGFWDGGVAHFDDGQIRAMYAAAAGLGEGRVNQFQVDQDGTLWAATEGGLSQVKDGRVATLTSKSGLPCDAVQWVIEDDARSFWLQMPCGLVRIGRSDVDMWARDPKRTIQTTVFDSSDGVRSQATPFGLSPKVAKSKDGRLWFTAGDAVSVVDPRHIPFNSLPPPVHIEQITADRKTYDMTSGENARVSLPALTRDLQIDYTALSLVAHEKMRFRYKLEGKDRDWQDVGTRRQAFYNDLPPRNYRFRVIASNNSGVWNEAGASLDFAIAPAYYQTRWFEALVGVACLTLLWAAYQIRVRRIAREFDLRLDERVNERTRVARELHDTLLQSFHGALFRFQATANMLPERPAEAKQTLESAIDRAAQAITEGRDAIQDLRASTVVTNDLAVAISTLGNELAASDVNGNGTVVCVAVQGTSRELHPIVRDDICRIAGEALRNAFRHAHARRIEVAITYDDRQFRLQVRDDGKGMDPAVPADQRPGHYGLPGMRERAELVGGRLDVWSELDAGTEVDLRIPAAKAYAAARARRRAWWFGKKTGTNA